MRYAKMFLLLCVAILGAAVMTGCNIAFFDATQINDVEFIRAVGIDKAPEGKIRFTIATQRIVTGGERGGPEQKLSEIMYSEGRTGFEAARNFWAYSEKRPFFGHLEYILIGEEAAKDGILKYLDFFTRDPEDRLNLNVFVVKGTDAGEMVRQGNTRDKFVFDRLEGIKEHYWGLSMINRVDLMEIMYILDTEYLSLYIPCVKLTEKTENSDGHNEGMDIALEGFAIFEGDRLAGYLEREMARGLSFLRNMAKSGVLNVRARNGSMVALELISSNRKMKPELMDGELRVAIEIDLKCNIAEIQSSEGVFDHESLRYLEEQSNQLIMDEVMKVIEFAREKRLDCFAAGDAVMHKYPCKWEDYLEKNWRDIFSEIDFEVTVRTNVSRTYDIKQPIGAKDIK
ncbi:MAG TPA: Ger(x)C family spore germination protein [Clostridiales bacterium]|nr:Ger(x)C family spore germination protein [Clostridiales bacterium]HPV01655.1 Ger(x)C family spore germination protein [Clostridiales bacterium]